MAGLSRRAFLATTTALAGSFALPNDLLARSLAAPLTPSGAPSTLQQTIRLSQTANQQYRNLVAAPGEPYIVRTDLLGQQPNPKRAAARRSLAYLGHFSDIHIVDAQSPGRLEPLIAVAASFIDASRPQDTMTVQVLAQMVEAVDALSTSPLTGAPMNAALNTGDSADSRNSLELQWCIDMLDGRSVVPNSGKRGEYQGVQVWDDLDNFLLQTWRKADGTAYPLLATCIDSGGHHTDAVYRFAKERLNRRIFAIKGMGGSGVPFIRNPSKNNRVKAELFILGVDAGKTTIYQRLEVKTPGPNYCHFPSNPEAGYTEEYFKGLTAEKKVVRFVKGRLKEYWEIKDKEHKRNEPLDLRNYATAALAISRPVLKKTDADGTTVQPVKKARGRRQLSGGI